ncbi:hypothetical protein DJ564_25755 [Pseudomonas sp. 31-12]|nr:hypothetical protein DJ564_25755 [Pseudomonas sp. 31-12]
MNPRITGTGHTGITGHAVFVFPNVSEERIGSGWVVDGRWSADVFLAPGRHVLTTAQLYGPAISERTASRVYHVRPPSPTLRFEPVDDRIELFGTGYRGTGVQVHITLYNIDWNYLTTPVDAGQWRIAIPATLVPNKYAFSCRQSVSDGGSGLIYSNGWTPFVDVTVPTPEPIVANPTVNDLNVTFSGSGHQWGNAVVQVNIFKGKGVEPADVIVKANVLPSRGWTERVPLSPGTYPDLTARQWVNSQFSEAVAIPPVVVLSPIPNLGEPRSGAIVGQTPQLTGSAYQGSVITFSIPGQEPFTVTAGETGIFDLPAKVELPPATHTMTVTAAFGGQISQPLTRTFTVRAPKPKISASDGDKLDPVPTLTGLGYKDCWVVIHAAIGHRTLGSGPVGPDGTWSVELEELLLGELAIYAVQLESQGSSNKSDPTDTVTLDVVLQSPTILIPVRNGKTERMSQFSGKALYRSTVELYLEGQSQPFIKDIVVERDNTWKRTVTLHAGQNNLEVAIRYKGTLSLKSEHTITVVPAVPKIDTPLPAEKVGKRLTMSGFGHVGDEIVIASRDPEDILGSTPVLADKTWSATIEQTIATDLRVAVMARAGAGLDSAYTDTIQFTKLTPAPKIVEPQPGDWTGVRPLYSGLAEPGATITVALWFNADTLLAEPTVADENGRWSVWGNKDLLEGAVWVVIRQTLDGIDSEWVESGRFMVERMPANFEAPTVTFPLIGQKAGQCPMFEGTGVRGSEVHIFKKGNGNVVVARARVDRYGAWAVRSQIELPVGDDYECSVHQTRDGATSKWLVPDRKFNVIQVSAGFAAPIIEAPQNDPLKTQEQLPEFSGTGVVGAEVVVRIYNKPDVLAKTIVDARNKWRVRSEVVMGVGGHEIVVEQFRDGQRSASSRVSFTVAEKLDLPVFGSPDQYAHISPDGVVKGTALPGTTVRLVESGNPVVEYGNSVADAQGRWLIVLQGLPLKEISLTGEGINNQMRARWMAPLVLKVINAG